MNRISSPVPYPLPAGRYPLLGLAAASLVLGAGAIFAPQEIARLLGDADLAGHPAGSGYYRVLGLRDVVVGAGLIAGMRRGSVRPWLLVRAVGDLLDAATIGLPAVRHGRRRQMLTGLGLPLASVATSLGLWALLRTDENG